MARFGKLLHAAVLPGILTAGGCVDPTPGDAVGVWRADNGSTLVLTPEGGCEMRGFDWTELFFTPAEAERQGLQSDCGAEWELAPDAFDSRVPNVEITVRSNGDEFTTVFHLQFAGRGFFGCRRPYDLRFNLGDPDDGKYRTFRRTQSDENTP